jgi:hypothetical protein
MDRNEGVLRRVGMDKLQVIEHNSQRVLTTQQLAEVYETDTNNIHMNYSNNKDRFIEDIHYHILSGEDLRKFKESLPNDIGEPMKFAPSLFLWTEKGASRHCKILDTDMAWRRFDELEDTYFRVKELQPKCIEDLIILQAQSMKQLREEVNQLHGTTQAIKDAVISEPDNWREDINHKLNKIAQTIGENKYKELRSESYKFLEQRAGVLLQRRLDNKRTRMLTEGASKTAINNACKLDVIDEDKKLREIYSKIISEYLIKFVA